MLEEARQRQHGVVTRKQALASGLGPGSIRSRLRSGRWRRLYPGVYATFTGPLVRPAQLWAVLLVSGRGAVLSHDTAAELAGLVDEPTGVIHVTVPAERTTCTVPGVCQHVSTRVRRARQPTRLPPQTRIEETVVDLTQSARDVAQAMNWVVRACARRLTTAQRLRAAFARRPKLRWRADLAIVLEDVDAGCHSMLEVRYARDVERRHGLPMAQRQAARVRCGGRWYDDVHYQEYRTVVELDGLRAHPIESRARDMRRDNAGVADGLDILRYGPVDVAGRPCEMAGQIARVLRRNGWTGQPHPCGPACLITGT